MAKTKKKILVDPMQSVRVSVTLRYWQVERLQGKEATREVIYSIVYAMTIPLIS